jgi:hypothetical protein
LSLDQQLKSVEQRVPVVWTTCHLGGRRPWFLCTVYTGERYCGRRVAKLYLGHGAAFACRQCHGLAYASQQETPRHRSISQAQKIRKRLGGSANLMEPFPEKPQSGGRMPALFAPCPSTDPEVWVKGGGRHKTPATAILDDLEEIAPLLGIERLSQSSKTRTLSRASERKSFA